MAVNEVILSGQITPAREKAGRDMAIAARTTERRYYFLVGLLFAGLVVVGFSKNYYFRFLFDMGPLYSNMVRFHAVVMTAWIVLFATQTWLVASNRVRLHMKLGIVGVGLSFFVLTTGYFVAIGALEHQTAADRGGIPPLAFLVVPLADLALFVVYFGGAILWRRKPANHKRLMLLSAANFLPPAVARFPVAWLQAYGPWFLFGVPTVLTVAALVYDIWKNRKVNWVFVAGSVLLIASFPGRLWIAGTDWWMTFATWLAG